MPKDEIFKDQPLVESLCLRPEEHAPFFQHQYVIAGADKKITTTQIRSCIAVFIQGISSKNEKIGVGIHIGLDQTKDQIDTLIKKLKTDGTLSRVISYVHVGGDYGLTPPPFRSSSISNAINAAMKQHFGVEGAEHEFYNKVGNFPGCCGFTFSHRWEKSYIASMDVSTGKLMVSDDPEILIMAAQLDLKLFKATQRVLFMQDEQSSWNFQTPAEVIKQFLDDQRAGQLRHDVSRTQKSHSQ